MVFNVAKTMILVRIITDIHVCWQWPLPDDWQSTKFHVIEDVPHYKWEEHTKKWIKKKKTKQSNERVPALSRLL